MTDNPTPRPRPKPIARSTAKHTNVKTLGARVQESPATRRLVRDVLALAESCDPVDALHDVETAAAVLRERLDMMQARFAASKSVEEPPTLAGDA